MAVTLCFIMKINKPRFLLYMSIWGLVFLSEKQTSSITQPGRGDINPRNIPREDNSIVYTQKLRNPSLRKRFKRRSITYHSYVERGDS